MTRADAHAVNGGWVLGNTHPPNTTIVASCIDTLHLGYRGVLKPERARELEAVRTALLPQGDARIVAWENNPEAEVTVSATSFAARPCAHHGYRYRLFNGDLTLMVNPRPPGGVPTILAQISSAFLWRVGWRQAVHLTDRLSGDLLAAPGSPPTPPIVSRLDVCADFQGWVPAEGDRLRFVTRARHLAVYEEGGAFTGISFGRGTIVGRLYDKTVELRKSGKGWMHAIWESGGYSPEAPVWRLEFQLRRAALREFGLSTTPDLEAKLGGLWGYLSHRWLRLVTPIGGSRRERSPLDPHWKALSAAEFGSVGGEIVRDKERSAERERAVSGLLGYATTYAAIEGTGTLQETLRSAERAIQRRLDMKYRDFQDVARRKARRLSTVEL